MVRASSQTDLRKVVGRVQFPSTLIERDVRDLVLRVEFAQVTRREPKKFGRFCR